MVGGTGALFVHYHITGNEHNSDAVPMQFPQVTPHKTYIRPIIQAKEQDN